METSEILQAIDDATTDEEKLRIEVQAIEDTAKPLDPLERTGRVSGNYIDPSETKGVE